MDWYPWGPEALSLARAEDRPILLSIGYSSCHWCHVMERESFEDPSTAALMNRLFVNIKVDREERPDIDQIYMKAVQAMTGGGGWPMTVFLTPDRVPYFGGTYFPPEPRRGMPSFSEVLEAASEAYTQRRDTVEEGGARLLEALQRSAASGGGDSVGVEALDQAHRGMAGRYDSVHGGFGRAPKFPQPVALELLLRQHLRTGDPQTAQMAVHTLRRMAAGGLRDHLAGGFHRYSVDARWLVPHFEKMLYDNALLARAYLDGYRVTGEPDLRDVATQTLDYLLDDMCSPEGGFYSARDADSEGEEGTFYVWSPEEVEALLDADTAALFSRVYDVTAAGNFEGRSILHLPHPIESIAEAEGIELAELESRLADARETLLATRSGREPPFRDEKILVSWNGLAIRAFAEIGATLGRWSYVDAGAKAGDFIWEHLRPDGRLLHSYASGAAKIEAFLDDHAALGNAFLSLHGATLDGRWLDRARWLADEILDRFQDKESGTLFDTAADAEALIFRPRDPMDSATPSGPSLAAELLLRLGHALDEERYRDAAHAVVDHEGEMLVRYAPAFGRMLSVLDRRLAEPTEVVIVGGDDEAETRELIRAAHADLVRGGIVVGRAAGAQAAATPLLTDREAIDGRATVYVCRSYACRLPVHHADEVVREMRSLA